MQGLCGERLSEEFYAQHWPVNRTRQGWQGDRALESELHTGQTGGDIR